jgi:hypothetical protein
MKKKKKNDEIEVLSISIPEEELMFDESFDEEE